MKKYEVRKTDATKNVETKGELVRMFDTYSEADAYIAKYPERNLYMSITDVK